MIRSMAERIDDRKGWMDEGKDQNNELNNE